MDKSTLKAFEKMQKQEHYIRVARERKALGRVSYEAYREEVATIKARFALSEEEQAAYARHVRQTRKG